MKNDREAKKKSWTDRRGTRGKSSKLLEERILELAKRYPRVTRRQLFYRLVQEFGYPKTRRFERTFGYHFVKLMRQHAWFAAKVVDRSRRVEIPPCDSGVEVWVEKETIAVVVEDIVRRYGARLVVTRGFCSYTQLLRALERARDREIRCVLYIGDLDPSGLCIQEVCERELGVKFKRVALTPDQVRHYRLPSKPVNPHDSRTKGYVRKHGHGCYEVEALDPNTLGDELRRALKRVTPREFLKCRERALRADRVVEQLITLLKVTVLTLIERGRSEEEIVRLLEKQIRHAL